MNIISLVGFKIEVKQTIDKILSKLNISVNYTLDGYDYIIYRFVCSRRQLYELTQTLERLKFAIRTLESGDLAIILARMGASFLVMFIAFLVNKR